MRADVARDIDLYGELHRYIPVLAAWAGYRTGEVDVTHHARAEGQSKFGAERFWRGLLDLVTVKFITTYNARPFHLFGGNAALTGAVGGARPEEGWVGEEGGRKGWSRGVAHD